jgi:hypothetical protein
MDVPKVSVVPHRITVTPGRLLLDSRPPIIEADATKEARVLAVLSWHIARGQHGNDSPLEPSLKRRRKRSSPQRPRGPVLQICSEREFAVLLKEFDAQGDASAVASLNPFDDLVHDGIDPEVFSPAHHLTNSLSDALLLRVRLEALVGLHLTVGSLSVYGLPRSCVEKSLY